MKNNVNIKYMIYMILTILGILALTRLYVYYTVDDIDEVKPVGKIEEVQDVENLDEIEVEDILELNTTKEENNTKVNAKVVKTKVDTEKVVYGSDLGDGYNMELNVPEKWSHLDYTHLGNPKEVALKPEEYLPGDKLYSKDDPRYYDEGKFYFGAKAEKALLDMFQNRETLEHYVEYLNNKTVSRIAKIENPNIPDDYYIDAASALDELFSDINNFVYVDEETGRKEVALKQFNDIRYKLQPEWYLCGKKDTQCITKDKIDILEHFSSKKSVKNKRENYEKDMELMKERTVITEHDYNEIIKNYGYRYFMYSATNLNLKKAQKKYYTDEKKMSSKDKYKFMFYRLESELEYRIDKYEEDKKVKLGNNSSEKI